MTFPASLNIWLVALIAAVLGADLADAKPGSVETAVKAAFLPKFAAYVTWPPEAASAGQPVQLCVIGRDPFGTRLDQAAASEHIGARGIEVRRLDGTENAAGCNVAFLTGSAKQTVADMLGALRDRPVLTVTDARFGSQQGMIHFIMAGGRVRFDIDDALVAAGNLALDARLMGLAVTVRPRVRT